jgi:hypothetical protein
MPFSKPRAGAGLHPTRYLSPRRPRLPLPPPCQLRRSPRPSPSHARRKPKLLAAPIEPTSRFSGPGATKVADLPATADVVAAFLVFEASRSIKPSTIARRVAAIRYAHKLAGHEPPTKADRLGVAYTPNEIVRFMVESADWLCQKHFGKALIDKQVGIFDPAAGTGTFITELIEHFRGQPAKLRNIWRSCTLTSWRSSLITSPI